MLKSYKAIYDHGRLEWLDTPPRTTRTRVLVIVDEHETTSTTTVNDPDVAELLEQIAARAFGDPFAWQRAERAEHDLPGRT
jgi:hypothetical protein